MFRKQNRQIQIPADTQENSKKTRGRGQGTGSQENIKVGTGSQENIKVGTDN